MPLALVVVLVLVGLALAAASVWLVLPLRRRVDQLTGDVNALQVALDDLRTEVGDLRAAAEILPVPPLPKTRSGGLDDLRERLRAAHTEGDEPSDE